MSCSPISWIEFESSSVAATVRSTLWVVSAEADDADAIRRSVSSVTRCTVDEVAVSEPVKTGAPLCRIHARTQAQAEQAVARVVSAFEISETPVSAPPLVVEIL